MARISYIVSMDKEYVKSGRWKCPTSPTGAHHSSEVSREHGHGLFLCKYCLRIQRLPTGYDGVMRRVDKALMDPMLNPGSL